MPIESRGDAPNSDNWSSSVSLECDERHIHEQSLYEKEAVGGRTGMFSLLRLTY